MRRQRKHHSKGDILIDLTSLLDVIFIILMIVTYNQQNATSKEQLQLQVQQKEIEEQWKDATEKRDEAEAQRQLYSDQVNTVDNLCLISVNARYETDNVTVRHISILKNGEDIEEGPDMIGNNTDESLDKLKEILKEYIDLNKEKPIILSLNENDEKILYRDEKAIKEIFDELKNDYANVYLK